MTLLPSGGYTIAFRLLFELEITSGVLKGLTFDTTQTANSTASNLAALPFPFPTAFSEPNGSDAVDIYVQADPTGTYPAGTLAGYSSHRIVTATAAVPGRPGILLAGSGLGLLAAWGRGRRKSAAGDR